MGWSRLGFLCPALGFPLLACGGAVSPAAKGDASADSAPRLDGTTPLPDAGLADAPGDREPGDGPRDSAPDGARDAGYPAPHATAPQVESFGGPVLAAPNVVPVFFGNDPLQSQIEQFLTKLAGSSYWPAVTSEYGAGALTVAPSIVVTDALPSSIKDPQIEAWLAGYLDGTHAAWPAINANNIYMVFYQSGTSISYDIGGQTETSCAYFGGYHNEGAEGSLDAGGAPFVYAVIPRCSNFAGYTGTDAVTLAVSHETVEATTDPLPISDPAYATVDQDHLVWDFQPLSEIGDMCAYEPQSFQRLVGSFIVQRIWSNKSAAAGADPCVPPLGGVYFNAAPDLTNDVILTSDGQGYTTLGVQIPVGQTKTIDFRLFSTGPTADWTIFAEDTSAAYGGPPLLQFTPSQANGNNGDVIGLQVTAVAAGPLGGSEFLVYAYRSADESYINYWFGFVQN
jgi:hypothetical protein